MPLPKHLDNFLSWVMLYSEFISHLVAFMQQDLYYNTLLSGNTHWCNVLIMLPEFLGFNVSFVCS